MNPILKNKKYILFDVGFTLNRPKSGHWFFTKLFLKYTNKEFKKIKEEDINNAYKIGVTYFKQHHKIKTINDEIKCYINFYKIILKELNIKLENKKIIEIAKDRATNMKNYILYPNIKSTLNKLSKNYKLGIISDTFPSIKNQLLYFGIYKYFSSFTFSYEFGVFKPNKILYLDAIKKSKCKKEELVFIDDNLNNLIGAKKLGITPILITANHISDVKTNYKKIKSIKELLE